MLFRSLSDANHVMNKTGKHWDDLFRFVVPGFNLRPIELSGAIGRIQLKKIDRLIEIRRKNAKVFQELFENGVTLITKIKKNMKNILMETSDKLMLMRRSFIETIFSSMKALNTMIHHRHRSVENAFCHLLAALVHYQLRDDKPSLHSFINISSYP